MERQLKLDTVWSDEYAGTAVMGTPDNSPNWRIYKKTVSGSDYTITYPIDDTGLPSSKEEFKWSDRTLLNFQSTEDIVAPTLSSAARTNNTTIEVTLSELADVDSITKANAGGFTVEETGTPATTYAVASIAPGATNNKIILTVATMLASAAAWVTVKYAATGNGTVEDVAWNALETDATGVVIAAW